MYGDCVNATVTAVLQDGGMEASCEPIHLLYSVNAQIPNERPEPYVGFATEILKGTCGRGECSSYPAIPYFVLHMNIASTLEKVLKLLFHGC